MTDIFISYAREDREHAHALAGALQQRGWTVWWDRLIPAGGSFNRIIEEELNRAKCVIVLWSRHSIESNYVQNEASEAEARGVLVPVLVEQVRIPLPFRHRQATPIDDVEHLAASVAPLLGREARPVAPPASPRHRTWLSVIVIAAIIVIIAMIAKKADEPTTTTTSAVETVATDTASAAPGATKIGPYDPGAPVDREIRLSRITTDQSVNVYASFDRNEPIAVQGPYFRLRVHCGPGIDSRLVTIELDTSVLPAVVSSDANHVTISADAISPTGNRLRVMYESKEVASLTLRK